MGINSKSSSSYTGSEQFSQNSAGSDVSLSFRNIWMTVSLKTSSYWKFWGKTTSSVNGSIYNYKSIQLDNLFWTKVPYMSSHMYMYFSVLCTCIKYCSTFRVYYPRFCCPTLLAKAFIRFYVHPNKMICFYCANTFTNK